MSITVKEHYHAVVIEPKGKLLGSTMGRQFRQKVDGLKEDGLVTIVVDLGQTEFMDSSGIGVLVGTATTVRNAGGDMRLANLDKRIHGLFMVTKMLGSVFENFETVDKALESFKERPTVKESLATGFSDEESS